MPNPSFVKGKEEQLPTTLTFPPMDLLRSASQFSTAVHYRRLPSPSTPRRPRFSPVRSSLPFPNYKAKYHRELEAAIDAVERACSLCVDVQRSLFATEGRVLEKNDETPVTVADFGVQALISLELSKSFPSIPLVAEEDSGYIRANNLVDAVVTVVTDKVSANNKPLEDEDVLEAIDRGGKNATVYCTKPATYWVLDPIDGTKGFVKGNRALYVVGLALVVEGEIVLGVMGCPNWVDDISYNSSSNGQGHENIMSKFGIVMVSHVGCGTWTRELLDILDRSAKAQDGWTKCIVDRCHSVPKARVCTTESQVWEGLPLSALYNATYDPESVGDKEILLLSMCCGSLSKYLMVASGRASVYIQAARDTKILQAWDHAVGIICVHEAGGKVSDWEGMDIDFGADQTERRVLYPSGGFLVTNGNIHAQLLEMLAPTSAIA
ncbi:putative 3'(2'),5'-bisphosphate nucleotidase, mitochondrial [Euphorbia lathyris]|uniref:putative 3'(2'),5'-bisphosphate nucleotidase, mitochondrial n=1 Tax=Euphorbia lathyris TaxID=212925 RepID=UPI003313267D